MSVANAGKLRYRQEQAALTTQKLDRRVEWIFRHAGLFISPAPGPGLRPGPPPDNLPSYLCSPFQKTLKKADAPCPMQKSSAYKAVRFPGEHFIPLCVFYSIHRSGVKGKPRFPCRATAHLFFAAALFRPYEICQIAPGGLTRGRAAPYDTDIPKPVWRAHCRGTIPPAKLFSLGGPL